MLHDNSSVEKSIFSFDLKSLKIFSLLRKAGIFKGVNGIPASEVFTFLLTLVFHKMNLFSFLNSSKKETASSKNTYYRFLNNPSFNWNKFILSLSTTVITFLSKLTSHKRVKCFIVDDTPYSRDRSKNVELLSKVYNHVTNKFIKGFTLLPLAWTDGFSTIPVTFRLLSSPKKENRYNDITDTFNKNSLAYKRRLQSMESKPESVVSMLNEAANNGIYADYVLMDTWFTSEPLIIKILELGMNVIGMVKPLKQRYIINGEFYTLNELKKKVQFCNINGDIMGSVIAETKNGVKVKIVFVKHRNNRRKILCILSTDLSLNETEIIRIYSNRWNIETMFKAVKSHLKLGKEFQSRSYDALVSHTAIVFTRYILLEWRIRNEKDYKTIGGLFNFYTEEIGDKDYKEAMSSLMNLLVSVITTSMSENINEQISKVKQWYDVQLSYIKGLFTNLVWES